MVENNTDNSGLVDFHCHLDLYPDHEQAVQQAESAGIFTLAVTTTPRAWPRNHELAQKTKYVRAALGLHPQLVAEHEAEIAIWDNYLSETRYVGEVGLDAGPRFYKSIDAQKRVFRHVLQRCSEAGDKILSVHSIRASKLVLDFVEELMPPGKGKVVLHWFTGTKKEVQRAIKLGCYFSVNSTMLANERHLSMVMDIPLERILTETDGPFTKTVGRPSVPSDVAYTIDRLGRLHKKQPAEFASIIRANLRELLIVN
ncbi:TatD family deoxyribonuclease [Nitrincola tibetensis]|uniref:TatD family deoxyribonuclease n=1 Tax=Nitrincola tibetensis TaxID=2219697 RepID=A0A364NRE8_9GAMM|nr:Qat anti-phage system TatD family nuclease QatD [Nitrincola tibetensis]RAU19602.1 TatD family deoxyribonuclease [Nitrincola tibetensis]